MVVGTEKTQFPSSPSNQDQFRKENILTQGNQATSKDIPEFPFVGYAEVEAQSRFVTTSLKAIS